MQQNGNGRQDSPTRDDGGEVPFGSNAVRLRPRHWLIVVAVLGALMYVIPTVWSRIEKLQPGRDYRVRHQVTFADGVDRCRFRIWPADEPEGDAWLCEESDVHVPDTFTKFTRASFGLFQNAGTAIEWFDIRLRDL